MMNLDTLCNHILRYGEILHDDCNEPFTRVQVVLFDGVEYAIKRVNGEWMECKVLTRR